MGFKGLEKLKRLECLRQPVCSPSSIQENASKSERRKKVSKSTDSNRGIPSDNTNLEKKEKLAKRRLEKLRKEKEEREKQEKEKKEEHEKADKEKKDKERAEKTEKKKKAEQERKAKQRQERKEREASIAAAKKEKEEKEAAAKKEREEKDAAAKKEREAKAQKDLENKKEMTEPKTNDVVIKKKVSSTSHKSKLKESSVRSTNTAISTRKIMPSKPTTAKLMTPPASKLKKDENNKKVMENRKAAAIKKSKPDNDEKLKVKKIVKKQKPSEEGRTVDEQSVAEKVSEAIASGEIDNSRVIKDNDQEGKEPVVEMESCPPEDLEAGQDEDEDDIELQRIKDEEEEDNQEPVPDIAEKMADVLKEEENLQPDEPGPETELRQAPAPLVLEKQEKISYTHVKTPDEVDDLPEHEVVAHEINLVADVNEETIDHEEKIVNDK